MIALKLILKIVIAPVILLLTLAIWICVGLVYVSGLVLGLLSTVIALLGVAVLITYSPQNGLILLVIAFLISPFGLPKLAFWLLGKVQEFEICNSGFGLWLRSVLMGKSNKVCPVCGRKMKCQFIGLQHCKCGMSWKKDVGIF